MSIFATIGVTPTHFPVEQGIKYLERCNRARVNKWEMFVYAKYNVPAWCQNDIRSVKV